MFSPSLSTGFLVPPEFISEDHIERKIDHFFSELPAHDLLQRRGWRLHRRCSRSQTAPDEDNDSVSDAEDICPGTVIPEDVPTERLGVNRFALMDGDAIFDTTPSRGKGPREVFTLSDTAGCSCAQIIEALGLGKGHTKFGCSSGAMREWIEMVHP